ncbi:MAG: hypothetical protein RL543_97 [Pseudomonadota bacterium]|jgi:hypothetical protein
MGTYFYRLRQKTREIGLANLVKAGASGLVNRALRLIYRFDPWHVSGTYFSRPYKAKVVDMINARKPDCVVEIGTGLGDLIGRVSSAKTFGFDLDPAVLKAARWLLPRTSVLAPGNFQEPDGIIATLKQHNVRQIDCLVLVNWIHMIDFDTIERSIERIDRACPIRSILMDSIKAGADGYRFHHSEIEMKTLGRIVQTRDGDETRTLVMIERGP